jgi:lysophospholipase L1-like esterase
VIRRVVGRVLPPLALVAGSVFAMGLALEVAFRVLDVPVGTVQINRATIRRTANPRLLFELRPGSSIQAEVRYSINSLGMRGPEVSEEKPSGVVRVAVIGDSIAFGYWVQEKDAFPRQLERMLGGPRRVEVLNFGVPGYDLEQYVETVRTRALSFAPDVVVVAFCLNDLEGLTSYEYGLTVDRAARRRSFVGTAYEALLAHSRLFSWIEYRMTGLEARRIFIKAREAGPLYGETPEQQVPRLEARFTALETLLRPRHIPALVAVFPVFGKRFDRYGHRDLHRAILGAAEAAGLGAVDLLDCYSAYDFREVRVDLIHPNPLGHRIAARAIRDALCSRGLACASAPPPERTCRDYDPAAFPKVKGY